MATVTGIIDYSIYHLFHFKAVEKLIPEPVGIIFTCAPHNQHPDDFRIENGIPVFTICLDYEVVKNMTREEINAFMLIKARERIFGGKAQIHLDL